MTKKEVETLAKKYRCTTTYSGKHKKMYIKGDVAMAQTVIDKITYTSFEILHDPSN